MKALYVVSCGKAKRDRPAKAAQLYTGHYFRALWNHAFVATGGDLDRIRILSAQFGLVEPETVIAPYDLTLAQLPKVQREWLARDAYHQAAMQGLLNEPRVIVLGGRAYVNLARHVWACAEAPLLGIPGFQAQKRRLLDLQLEARAEAVLVSLKGATP